MLIRGRILPSLVCLAAYLVFFFALPVEGLVGRFRYGGTYWGIPQLYDSEYGTICFTQGDVDQAKMNTVCKKEFGTLGFSGALSFWKDTTSAVTGTIWHFDCSSTSCSNFGPAHTSAESDHQTDTFLVCRPPFEHQLSSGNFGRLDVRATPSEAFGSVCGAYGFTVAEAQVACRGAGYSATYATSRYATASERGSGASLLTS